MSRAASPRSVETEAEDCMSGADGREFRRCHRKEEGRGSGEKNRCAKSVKTMRHEDFEKQLRTIFRSRLLLHR